MQLGRPVSLSELTRDSAELQDAFLNAWQEHPYCQYIITKQECWEYIRQTAIVTTEAIMTDPNLEKLHP